VNEVKCYPRKNEIFLLISFGFATILVPLLKIPYILENELADK
jgi:hypothetical protein